MVNSVKGHYYLTHASFRDRNRNHDLFQEVNGDINLKTNRITKSILAEITEEILKDVCNKNPDMDIYDFKLNSISYLGEMTEEEFNS